MPCRRLCLSDHDRFRMQLCAWLCSLAVHFIALGGAIEFIRHVRPLPVTEPFRWVVALVQPPATLTDSAPIENTIITPDQQGPISASKSSPPAPTAQGMSDIAGSERGRASGPGLMAAPERTPLVALKEQLAEPDSAMPEERKSHSERSEEAPPSQSSERQATREVLERPVREPRDLQTQHTETEPPVPGGQRWPISPAPAPPILSSAPSQEERAGIAHQPQEIDERVTASSHVQPQQEPAEVETGSEGNTASQLSALRTRGHLSAETPVARDYGWLQHALFKRLEEVKRRSRPLLDLSGGRKVLLRAVILESGNLGELSIERSSGDDRLDQEALRMVRQAFPFPLQFALGRPHVVVRIPISYSLSPF